LAILSASVGRHSGRLSWIGDVERNVHPGNQSEPMVRLKYPKSSHADFGTACS
jgi:hypothetical protein